MLDDLVDGKPRSRPLLTLPHPAHQRFGVRFRGECNQLGSKVFLKGPPASGSASGQLIPGVAGYVPDRDRRHDGILQAAAADCKCRCTYSRADDGATSIRGVAPPSCPRRHHRPLCGPHRRWAVGVVPPPAFDRHTRRPPDDGLRRVLEIEVTLAAPPGTEEEVAEVCVEPSVGARPDLLVRASGPVVARGSVSVADTPLARRGSS